MACHLTSANGRRIRGRRAVLIAGLASILSSGPSVAGAAVSGTVFNDHNSNGIQDSSGAAGTAIDGAIAAVNVTATAANGTVYGPVPSTSGGAYSLPVPDGTPVIVEFGTLPAGFEPARHGPQSGTSVALVTAPASGVSYGALRPGDYCQDNPTLVIACWAAGNAGGSEATAGFLSTLKSFPYANAAELDGNINGAGPSALRPDPADTASMNQIGTTYGQAWNRANRTLYSGAYLRRKARFGPSGTGAIYAVVNPTSTPSVSTFVDLEALFPGAGGANPHPVGIDWNRDAPTGPLVGKRSLGDLEVSADGSTLYAVSMADRHLYAIPTSGAPSVATIARFDIAAARPTSCTSDGDFRPMGLGVDRQGALLLGAVCSAETSGDAANLRMYVMRFASGAFTTVLDAPVERSGITWTPWSTVDNLSEKPEPMLSDIVTDESGALTIGLRDRYGDRTPASDLFPDQPPYPRGFGDILRACPSGATFVLETNGSCGSVVTGGASNGQGIGGGEFYYQDRSGGDTPEAIMGGLAYVPGYADVIATAYDAVSTGAANNFDAPYARNIYTGGVQRHGVVTGRQLGAYDVYTGLGPDPATATADRNRFGKANGLGDLEALCDAAPIEIGNRVWIDLDSDGKQDADEPIVGGLKVDLRDGAGNVTSSTNTDVNGAYYFPVVPNTPYSVTIDLAQPMLAPYVPTTPNVGASRTIDSNGVRSGGRVEAGFTSGAPGQSNHTYDFGFVPVASYDILKEVQDPASGSWRDADANAGTRGSNDGVPVRLTSGATANYRITVFNTGLLQLADVRVVDAWCGLSDTIATIAPGASATVTCAAQNVTASKVNTASVTQAIPVIPGGRRLTSLPNRSEDAAVVVGGAQVVGTPAGSKLALVKVGPAKAIGGQRVTYVLTVRVAKGTTVTARNVRVTDVAPKGLVLVGRTQLNAATGLQATHGTTTISVGNIAPGRPKVIRLTFRITNTAKGTLRNVARAAADNARTVRASAITIVTPKPTKVGVVVTG